MTDEMRAAARGWLQGYGPAAAQWLDSYAYDAIYRAMRRLEPKSGAFEPFAAQAVPAPGQPWMKGLHSERRHANPRTGCWDKTNYYVDTLNGWQPDRRKGSK